MGQCSIPSCYSKLTEINCGNRRVIINNQDSLLGEGSSAPYSKGTLGDIFYVVFQYSELFVVEPLMSSDKPWKK